jgi:hypothetical protein
MKIMQKKLMLTLVDRTCDICGQSEMINVGDHTFEELGELKATWGYGSKQDGKVFQLDLCERCFAVALEALRNHKNSQTSLTGRLTNEEFGLDRERSRRPL